MDNDQLLTELQKLLEESERRLAIRLDTLENGQTDLRDSVRQLRASLEINSKALTTNLESLILLMQDSRSHDKQLSDLTRRVLDLNMRFGTIHFDRWKNEEREGGSVHEKR